MLQSYSARTRCGLVWVWAQNAPGKPRNFNFTRVQGGRVLRTVWNDVAVHDPLLVWVKIASTNGLQGPIGVNRA